jgi:succinate dehydrogenase/fumarate reductase flavoprotein subunit
MRWDDETEVLIIGYGGAGAVAAITAHDSGARVLIVEKMEKGGGNTNISLGGFLSPKDLVGARQYLENLCSRVFRIVDLEMVQVYAEECMKNREWFEKQGAKTHVYGGAAFPQLTGAESIEKRMVTGSYTIEEISLWYFLRSRVESRQIPVWYSSPAKDLLTDVKGGVIGAIIQKEGEERKVKAGRAVILTCGGFEYDEWLKANYLKGYPYYSFASPGNTGEGVRMAQRVGADVWHMAGVSSPLGFKAPEFEAAFFIRSPSDRYIFVDQNGKRFASEVEVHAYNFIVDFFDPHTLTFPRIPCLLIFDQAARKTGPMGLPGIGYNRGRYSWSKDNTAEINRGWIVPGDTLAGLAKKVSLDPAALEKTVTEYNRCCELGEDSVFHRSQDKLAPLGPGPYYAMKLWPCLLNTQGGPRRNVKGQILYPDGRPILRLYSAGELGSLFGLLYQGAGNIGECLAFGRIAGREAAKEPMWE